MKFTELREQIAGDIKRQSVARTKSLSRCLHLYPWYWCTFSFRVCKYAKSNTIARFTILPVFHRLKRHFENKWGIWFPLSMEIGPGFRIEHPGAIYGCEGLVIGKNVSVSTGVIFGWLPRGINKGTPVSIGDNCYFAPGSKVIGKVSVGSDVVVGANSVVTKDVPDSVTVFGVPARIVSSDGAAEAYINVRVDQ
jgi:serine O-acetyltransferase